MGRAEGGRGGVLVYAFEPNVSEEVLARQGNAVEVWGQKIRDEG